MKKVVLALIVMEFSSVASWAQGMSPTDEQPWGDSENWLAATVPTSHGIVAGNLAAAASPSLQGSAHDLWRAAQTQRSITRHPGGPRNLPAAKLAGFVEEARRHGVAERVYGDEGLYLPSERYFKRVNTIETGMTGLSMDHGRDLPSAWLDTENAPFSFDYWLSDSMDIW